MHWRKRSNSCKPKCCSYKKTWIVTNEKPRPIVVNTKKNTGT